MHLSIDIETRSSADISKTGSYRYAQDKDFKILLFAYAYDDEEVRIVDLACGEELPPQVVSDLKDPSVIKHAYNAAFEWWCLNQAGYKTPLEQWRCTMIHGLYCGYTAGLGVTGEAVGLPEDKQKLTTGKALIRYFCVPRKPTETDSRPWNNPDHAPKKWALFKEYCVQDVVTEREIGRRLKAYPVPDPEWHLWHMDVRMNAFGVRVDMPFVKGSLYINGINSEELTDEAQDITGLSNPNSVQQLLSWMESKGVHAESLDKESVKTLLSEDIPDDVRRVLKIRQRLGKTSIKKYAVMETAAGPDDRVRGVSQFYGANRTGRWAGRLLQLQNATKNHIGTIEQAKRLIADRNLTGVKILYDDVQDLLSQLVRPALIPSEGRHFVVADFSAIEARVIAWLAGETWANEEFAGEGKIYEATAAQMFGVPKELIKKGNPEYELRQKGKVATLACIAEGQLVLTDKGLVPIQDVTTDMKVWDGIEWVTHDGVVYRGEKEVITYDGLTATEDHIVWIEGQDRPVRFGYAASCGARLLQSGAGRTRIWLGGDYKPGEKAQKRMEPGICSDKMHKLRTGELDFSFESYAGKIKGLPEMLPPESGAKMARQAYDCRETEMYESEGPELSAVWRPWYQIRFSECEGSMPLYDGGIWPTGEIFRNRQDRHKWELCTGERTIRYKQREQREPEDYCPVGVRSCVLAVCKRCCNKEIGGWYDERRDHTGCGRCCVYETEKLARNKNKTRVYDIRSAGPRNRFTVSGKLVHNCGYQGGTNSLITMGALKMGIPEEKLQDIIDRWRNANPHIVKLWRDVDDALQTVMSTAQPVVVNGLTFRLEGDIIYGQCFLTIELPTHRKLYYPKPHMKENRFGRMALHYYTQGQVTRKWEITSTYGGKAVENIIQAIARDCLAEILLRIEARGWDPVFHVHDEVICDVPIDVTAKDLCDLMAEPIPWAPGLVLRGAGFESNYYMKD